VLSIEAVQPAVTQRNGPLASIGAVLVVALRDVEDVRDRDMPVGCPAHADQVVPRVGGVVVVDDGQALSPET
jgi:hypothetical protein